VFTATALNRKIQQDKTKSSISQQDDILNKREKKAKMK
jgi:hypothetical protein